MEHKDGEELHQNEDFQILIDDVMFIENEGDCFGDSVLEKRAKTDKDLQEESKHYFESKVHRHEEAIAKLIGDLGPAFLSEKLPTRLRGLHVLLGALKGCEERAISNSCLILLGDFFVLQCGPIVDDHYEEDYDGIIRGVAMQCLSTVVGTPTKAMVEDGKEFADALQIRAKFAQEGVERRCAAPDDSNNEQMITEENRLYYKKDIRSGLSTLPRSKRSLCFDLLEQAVKGISKSTNSASPSLRRKMQQLQSEIVSSIQRQFVRFADFTAQCIHGESDPRCLQQLLELLHLTQATFCDWFHKTAMSSPNHVFPSEDVFDAVAPYYPIQFTPPPNNVHGITREGLHAALLSVLCFTKFDEGARTYRKSTMLGCSISLFLEQILPGHPNDENLTTLEKLESIECISSLLFRCENEEERKESEFSPSECKNLSVDEVRSLSTTLIATHSEASIGVNPDGGDLSDQNKLLAECCRKLAARVARELEKPSRKEGTALWEHFVSDPLDKEFKKFKLTPAYAKTSIAYVASLAVSGGPRTLRVCLAKGLVPLLEHLQEHKEKSDENVISAIHGIAAFVSSTEIAVSKAMEEGIKFSPHPLKDYAADTCELLLSIFENENLSESFSVKAAASSCLECILCSRHNGESLSEKLVDRICKFLETLFDATVGSERLMKRVDSAEFVQYQSISSKILGRILGASFSCSEEDSLSHSVLSISDVQDFVQTVIFPRLKTAAFAIGTGRDGDRYDRLALSTICSSNKKLATSIVGAHLEALLYALKDNILSQSTTSCLEALSHLLRSCVGSNAIEAFHENIFVDEILDELCSDLAYSASAQLRDSIVQIALPSSDIGQETLKSKIDAVISVTNGLVPAFTDAVPAERLKKLIKSISDKIPPLSKADDCVLRVRLPVLSAALQGADFSQLEEVVSDIDNQDGLRIRQLLQYLTDYVLSNENSAGISNAGALCVYGLLKGGFNRNLDCPTKLLLADVYKRLLASTTVKSMKIHFNFLSLMGSAAASRGASSSSTSDDIASFMMRIACEGSSDSPCWFDSGGKILDISVAFKDSSVQTLVKLVSASAYGAIVMENDIKPLTKQRLLHKFVKYIQALREETTERLHSRSKSNLGLLMIVCYVICAYDLLKFDNDTRRLLARLLISGFSSDLFLPSLELGKELPQELLEARTVMTSAMLKFICIVPNAVDDSVADIISGLLRSYAVCDPVTEIGCKLISLQGLHIMSTLDVARPEITAVKPAVISILSSAMAQKHALLRSAAVDVRNAWFLVT